MVQCQMQRLSQRTCTYDSTKSQRDVDGPVVPLPELDDTLDADHYRNQRLEFHGPPNGACRRRGQHTVDP
jgi:hypothetical protein